MTPEWGWCFNPRWASCDNTPKGAAKRIQYLLDNGIDKWDGDFDKHAIALYKDTVVKNSEVV